MAEAAKTKLEVHPAAAIFPMLDDADMLELGKSITAHGLREKIALIPNPEVAGGFLVLDGRNRLEALRKIGVTEKVIIEQYSRIIDLKPLSATPEEYVMMANIDRRNLTQPQRRALAGKLAIMLEESQKLLPKEERIDSLSEAAKKAGVSRRTAATAKKTAQNPSKSKKAKPKTNMVLPGVANAQLGKLSATLEKLGQNWSLTLLRETHDNASKIVDKLSTLIETKEKEEAASK